MEQGISQIGTTLTESGSVIVLNFPLEIVFKVIIIIILTVITVIVTTIIITTFISMKSTHMHPTIRLMMLF